MFETYKDTLKFLKWVERIEEFNRIINADNREPSFDLQVAITLEEVRETKEALDVWDVDEIMDGICDVIVTGSYLAIMNGRTGNLNPECFVDDKFETVIREMETELTKAPKFVDLSLVMSFYQLGLKTLGEDRKDQLDDYMERVLASNDTKILQYLMDTEIEREIQIATDKYKGKHDNIVYCPTESGLGVLRSDHGEGKVLKPSTYQDPKEVLV